MTRREIIQLCFGERQSKIENLQKQLKEFDEECEKLEFEENMYYHLKNYNPHYSSVYEQKQEENLKRTEELETKNKEIQEDIKILQREIDYINDKLG